jgi:ectoine hydroxylase-related dioxygenase (phytanoyl-CoA dioxygenase family)
MDLTESTAALDEQGYCLLEGVLTPKEADGLRERLMMLAREEASEGRGFLYGEGCQRVWNLLNKSELFHAIPTHPQVLPLLEHLLGESLNLSSLTGNIVGPGAGLGGWHVDYPLGDLPEPLPAFALVANSVWFLDDFTEENGATLFVPGSHRSGRKVDLQRFPGPVTPATGPKGSVLVLHGAMWHSSGANRTDRERAALLCFYCRGFMWPQQDHLESLSPAVLASAGERLQQLLRWRKGWTPPA